MHERVKYIIRQWPTLLLLLLSLVLCFYVYLPFPLLPLLLVHKYLLYRPIYIISFPSG